MPEPISVRVATPRDARAIARVHVRSWQQSYAHLFSPRLLGNLDVGRRAAGWTTILALGETDVAVAERGGEVVGWASAGPGRGTDAPRDRELEGIYVLDDAKGTGAGQRLLEATVGDAPAFLWVAVHNPRAEAFYRRNGFEHDGVRKNEAFGGERIEELRMVR